MRTLLLLIAVGCAQPSTPAHRAEPPPPAGPASRAASRPASAPAPTPKLDFELTETASLAADRLKAHVTYLASDELEGRGPATAGLEKAARYLADALKEAGVKPAFADGYLQPFEMVVATRVKKSDTYAPFPFSSSGKIKKAAVFAGYGIKADKLGYDDYAGLDVTDKIVFVLAGEPQEDNADSPFDGKKRTAHSSIRKKLLLAREAKAAALVVIRDKLKDRGTDPVSDGGLIAVEMTRSASIRALGLDVTALQKKIDADLQPQSQPAKKKVSLVAEVTRERRTVHNVGGMIPGSTDEWVVIGAHYDHLGYGGGDSLAGSDVRKVHNGADDNASGTAVVVEAARALVKEKPKRGMFFFLFAGEEDGLLGSAHLAKTFPVPIEKVAAMINLDMVGHLRNRKINVMGVKTGLELESFARTIVGQHQLNGSFGGDGYGPSDHTSFYARGVPVLFLFTGAHTHYHKPTDDTATLNFPGMARVGALATDMVHALARAEQRPTYVKAAPPKPTGGGGRGYGPYFGSIPDFGEDPNGVLLAGVRPGSPADKSGVQKGDVLVRFGKYEVKNLRDFTIALRDCAPGDVVELEVLRHGKRMRMKTTLGKRE